MAIRGEVIHTIGEVSISRQTGGDDDCMCITLSDGKSRLVILELKLSFEAFSKAITGQAGMKGNMRVWSEVAPRWGKSMEHTTLEFKTGKLDFDRKERKEKLSALAREACPAGWESDDYFNSQETEFKKDGEQWARTTMRRWV